MIDQFLRKATLASGIPGEELMKPPSNEATARSAAATFIPLMLKQQAEKRRAFSTAFWKGVRATPPSKSDIGVMAEVYWLAASNQWVSVRPIFKV
jgi:hypothetical protein